MVLEDRQETRLGLAKSTRAEMDIDLAWSTLRTDHDRNINLFRGTGANLEEG